MAKRPYKTFSAGFQSHETYLKYIKKLNDMFRLVPFIVFLESTCHRYMMNFLNSYLTQKIY